MSRKQPSSFANRAGPIRALGFTIVAVAAGALSLYMLATIGFQYEAKITEAQKPEETVMAMVASRDLYQGITITDEDIYAIEIPPRYLPENVFLSPDHVVGRIPRERILANEFVRVDRLADPEMGQGLNAVIPRGMRAISVDINNGQALSGFLNPTNYVDVLVTAHPEDEGEEPITQTILQAVFVLGVNSLAAGETKETTRERGKQKPSVTFLVTAQQAEEIAHAEVTGEVRLALRNDQDIDLANTTGVMSVDELRNRMRTQPEVYVAPPVVDEPGQTVLVYRGPDLEEWEVASEDAPSGPE